MIEDFEIGEPVEVAITDTVWVKAFVDDYSETRIFVRLETPTILVERTILKRMFRKDTVTEKSTLITKMSFGLGNGLVRHRT